MKENHNFPPPPNRGRSLRLQIKLIGLILGLCIGIPKGVAQSEDPVTNDIPSLPRPVTSEYGIGVGRLSLRSAYLSPAKYAGTVVSIFGDWHKMLPLNPKTAMMGFNVAIDYAAPSNSSHRASTMYLNVCGGWMMGAKIPMLTSLNYGTLILIAGGGPQLHAGADVLLRNSNNPVDAQFSATLNADISLIWRHHIDKFPFLASLRFDNPIAGAFFMPQYGETYYEIYLGNMNGLIHPAWWGNFTGFVVSAKFAFDIGRTGLSVAYRYKYLRASANHLVNLHSANSFAITITPGGYGLKKSRNTIFSSY